MFGVGIGLNPAVDHHRPVTAFGLRTSSFLDRNSKLLTEACVNYLLGVVSK